VPARIRNLQRRADTHPAAHGERASIPPWGHRTRGRETRCRGTLAHPSEVVYFGAIALVAVGIGTVALFLAQQDSMVPPGG
jgi:hypothetical protein